MASSPSKPSNVSAAAASPDLARAEAAIATARGFSVHVLHDTADTFAYVAVGRGLLPLELADAAWAEASVPAHEAAQIVDGSLATSSGPMAWSQDDVTVGGRVVREPRLTAFLASAADVVYTYSGKANLGRAFPPAVSAVRAWLADALERGGRQGHPNPIRVGCAQAAKR